VTALVFLGPSLSVVEASGICDAVYLPPAAQGDVYRAVKHHKPRVVAIVDGYFRQLPSVWHKEILWAMGQGVHVLGGASMGALRAAELSHFGMEGVGEIYCAYQSGRFDPFDTAFEDDDEVAVVHGPAEVGYVSASVAMVNMRSTLAQAAREGIIGENTRDGLAVTAKSAFYPKRSYKRLLADAAAQTDPNKSELEAFEEWLPTGMIDQKRLDARRVLERARELLGSGTEKQIDFHFEHTDLWQSLTENYPLKADQPADPALEQLRLEPQRYDATRKAAHYRHLALNEAHRRGMEVSARELREYRSSLRQAMELFSGASFHSWLESSGLDQTEFDRLLKEDLKLLTLRCDPDLRLESDILDELKLGGEYPALSEQAKRRAELVRKREKPKTHLDEYLRMLHWYFETIAKCPFPPDLHAYAFEQGFDDLQAFTSLVWGGYLDGSEDCE